MSTLCDALFEPESPLDRKDTLIVFDTSWLSYAAATAKAYNQLSFDGKPTGHIFGSMSKILAAFNAYGKRNLAKTELIFVFDEYPEAAYEIFPEYKHGRVKVFDPVPDVKNMVSLFSCHQAFASKTEADHVIGTIVTEYHRSHNIYIISADKDLWQLFGLPNVAITPRLNDPATQAAFEKKFGIKETSGIALHKAIFGDSSDNIPKLQGTLSHKVIKKYIDLSDGTPENLYSLLETRPEEMKQSVYDILATNKEWVHKIYGLTKLQTDTPYTMIDNSLDMSEVSKLQDFLYTYGINKFDNKISNLFY